MSSDSGISEALLEELCTIPYPVPSPLTCKICYNPRAPASTTGLRKVGIFKENSRFTRHLRDAYKIATASRVRYKCVRSLTPPPTSMTSPSEDHSTDGKEVLGELQSPSSSIFSPPNSSSVQLIPIIASPATINSSVTGGSPPVLSPAPPRRPIPKLGDYFNPPEGEKVKASIEQPTLAHLEEDMAWSGPPVYAECPPREPTTEALGDINIEDLVANIEKYDGSKDFLFSPSGCPSHRWSTRGIPSHGPVIPSRLSCSLPLHQAVDLADEGFPPANLEALSPVFSCESGRVSPLSHLLEETPIPSTQNQSTCTEWGSLHPFPTLVDIILASLKELPTLPSPTAATGEVPFVSSCPPFLPQWLPPSRRALLHLPILTRRRRPFVPTAKKYFARRRGLTLTWCPYIDMKPRIERGPCVH
ncbi:hypothetical protein NPIL_100691 [Nephila pilipes]|uniref:Uncharacterized protein n=1 Tax=Nephila pilipes TaxID=299642 RepID=A0A8X6U7V4_NEPPI|nr:hypothetical protein NPIL_100691 [Nephila pilipes]